MGKSTSSSSRGPKFDCQHTHKWLTVICNSSLMGSNALNGTSQPSVTQVSGDLVSILATAGTRHAHAAQIYMHAKHP